MLVLLGALGALLIVTAYLMIQKGQLLTSSIGYSAVSAIGAALVLFSFYTQFNFTSELIEIFLTSEQPIRSGSCAAATDEPPALTCGG